MTTVRGLFVNATERRSLQVGEVLFNEGDAGSEMFGVVDGSIELRHGDALIATVGPNDTFGEMAIIDHSPRALTAVAVQPSEVAVINEQVFLFLTHETPTFALQVMRSLTDRIRHMGMKV